MISVYNKTLLKKGEKVIVAIATGNIIRREIGHRSCRRDGIFGDPVNKAYKLLKKARVNNNNISMCDVTLGAKSSRIFSHFGQFRLKVPASPRTRPWANYRQKNTENAERRPYPFHRIRWKSHHTTQKSFEISAILGKKQTF